MEALSNNPPPDANPLRDRLMEAAAALRKRAAELLSAEARLPVIDSDEAAGKVGDYVKIVAAAIKTADSDREREKEPYLAGGRTVDGFYKKEIIDPLDALKRRVSAKITAYLREKEAAERARREAEERAAREAEAAAKREAAAKADIFTDDASLTAALAAEDRARQAEADRIAAEKAAQAKPAELSRTRGDLGALSSLRTFWSFDPATLNRNAIDLEALRPHLPIAALEAAIRSYIKAGGRDLRGVRIFEDKQARVS